MTLKEITELRLKATKDKTHFITEWWKGQGGTSSTCLSFVAESGHQASLWHRCKDFLHETLDADVRGKAFCSYSDPKIVGLDQAHTRMALSVGPDAEKGDTFIYNVLRFIRELDAAQGMEETQLLYGGLTQPGTYNNARCHAWVLVSDRRWQLASPLFSFYCMSIRLSFEYEGNGWDNYMAGGHVISSVRDRNYVDKSDFFWRKLIGLPPEEVFGYKQEDNFPPELTVGHCRGYLWMAQHDYTERYPHWTDLHPDKSALKKITC